MKFKNLFLLPLLFIATLSCNKSKDYDYIDLLVDKEWKLVSKTENGLEVSAPCELDNTIIFRTDSDVEQDFGSITCEDFEYETYKWTFADDYAQIKFKYWFRNDKGRITGQGSDPWEIVELTESTFVIKERFANSEEVKPVFKHYAH